MPDFTETESTTIQFFSIFLSIISLIGITFIIASYIVFPHLRKFSFKIIFYMTLADLGAILSSMLGDPETGSALCTIQAMGMQTWQLSSILWTSMISLTLYRAIVKHKESDHLLQRYNILCFAFPLFLSFLPFTTNGYGTTGAWCWIQADAENPGGSVWRLVLFFLPLWLAIVLNSYSYFLTIGTMTHLFKSQASSQIPPKYQKLIQRLSLYPLILVICWTPATINRIQNSIDPSNPLFSLFFLQVCGRSLQGFFNSLVYGMNVAVRDAWLDRLRASDGRGICGCFNRGFVRLLGGDGGGDNEVEGGVEGQLREDVEDETQI